MALCKNENAGSKMPRREFQKIKKYLTFSDNRFKALRSKSTNDPSQLNEEKAEKSKQEGSRAVIERDATVDIKSYDGDVTLKQRNSI